MRGSVRILQEKDLCQRKQPNITRKHQSTMRMPRATMTKLQNTTKVAITKKQHITHTRQVDTPHTLGITLKKREKPILKSMEANRSGSRCARATAGDSEVLPLFYGPNVLVVAF
jgi:hypothetical protein